VLAAATALSGLRWVVTVASPAPPSPASTRVPVLVLHAPADPVVSAHEASRVFAGVRHPKSFIALDGVDHAVSDPHQARRVARLITAWAEPYLPEPAVAPLVDPREAVVVTDAGTGRYTQRITAGHHVLTTDEPVSVGGADAGPNPYELLLAALGACTSMTLRMYADRKGVPLRRTTVRLRHDRVHAKDCAQTEQRIGMLSRIRREITMEGPLTDEDRERLVEIADRCPVHRTLSSEIAFETTGA
jgi:putative redox protein